MRNVDHTLITTYIPLSCCPCCCFRLHKKIRFDLYPSTRVQSLTKMFPGRADTYFIHALNFGHRLQIEYWIHTAVTCALAFAAYSSTIIFSGGMCQEGSRRDVEYSRHCALRQKKAIFGLNWLSMKYEYRVAFTHSLRCYWQSVCRRLDGKVYVSNAVRNTQDARHMQHDWNTAGIASVTKCCRNLRRSRGQASPGAAAYEVCTLDET